MNARDKSYFNEEIQNNLAIWKKKDVLRDVYTEFYQLIKSQINFEEKGEIVELGSGIGKIKTVIPNVITTDIFPNPFIDRQENAYSLSFEDNSVSNLILFDVWHHLKYPQAALNEFQRVLTKSGRLILFEPDVSLMGMLVYGVMHQEPLALKKEIEIGLPLNKDELFKDEYYAAQSNANKVFVKQKYPALINDWSVTNTIRISGLRYILSGGYSKAPIAPKGLFPKLKSIEKLLDKLPKLFSTRLLVVLEKNKI